MNRLDLDGRVAVITGGAQGIGLAIARRMRASGAAVALWDQDVPGLQQAQVALAAGAGAGHISTHALDITDEAAVAAAVAATLAAHGGRLVRSRRQVF